VKQKDALAKKIALEDTQATDLHPLAKKIAALLPDHETLTLSQIVKLTKGKPSTLKLRLKELVEKGYLVPKGQGRGRITPVLTAIVALIKALDDDLDKFAARLFPH